MQPLIALSWHGAVCTPNVESIHRDAGQHSMHQGPEVRAGSRHDDDMMMTPLSWVPNVPWPALSTCTGRKVEQADLTDYGTVLAGLWDCFGGDCTELTSMMQRCQITEPVMYADICSSLRSGHRLPLRS
jgi:hypothetical protein